MQRRPTDCLGSMYTCCMLHAQPIGCYEAFVLCLVVPCVIFHFSCEPDCIIRTWLYLVCEPCPVARCHTVAKFSLQCLMTHGTRVILVIPSHLCVRSIWLIMNVIYTMRICVPGAFCLSSYCWRVVLILHRESGCAPASRLVINDFYCILRSLRPPENIPLHPFHCSARISGSNRHFHRLFSS
jgi:hypothetical protein